MNSPMKLISMSNDTQPAAGQRPEHPATVIAQVIRKLTGVREELLDKIPAERTRYTALAAVMICTASIGGLSMFFTLSEVLGKAEPWFVLVAFGWAVFVLCIDTWLVSSTAGTRWRARVSVLVPRLAVAAVFGVVIAEPLVLRVFQTGIEAHVRHERQMAIDAIRTALVRCNPIPGLTRRSLLPPGACAGMTLNIGKDPSASSFARLQFLQGQTASLLAQVNIETQQLTRLQNVVNDECNGVSGNGLTGKLGNGPACKKDQQYVDNYQASHPMATQNSQLTTLGGQIRTLQATLASQQASLRTAIAQAIKARLRHETQPGAAIGMAERFQALSYLARSDSFIALASWVVRIVFILIDCLPVLVKFISGTTPYDRLADKEVASAERRFYRKIDLDDAVGDGQNSVTLYRAKMKTAQEKKEIDLQMLRQDADRDSLKGQAVEELAQRKLQARRGSTGRPGSAASSRGWYAGSSWIEDEHDAPHPNGSSNQTGHADDHGAITDPRI
jgi:hypothetical protein